MKAMDTFLRIKNLRKYELDHKSLVLGRTQYKLCYCISKKKTLENEKGFSNSEKSEIPRLSVVSESGRNDVSMSMFS